MTSVFLDVFLKQFSEFSFVRPERLIVADLLDATIFQHHDHVNLRQDCQCVGRKHARLEHTRRNDGNKLVGD